MEHERIGSTAIACVPIALVIIEHSRACSLAARCRARRKWSIETPASCWAASTLGEFRSMAITNSGFRARRHQGCAMRLQPSSGLAAPLSHQITVDVTETSKERRPCPRYTVLLYPTSGWAIARAQVVRSTLRRRVRGELDITPSESGSNFDRSKPHLSFCQPFRQVILVVDVCGSISFSRTSRLLRAALWMTSVIPRCIVFAVAFPYREKAAVPHISPASRFPRNRKNPHFPNFSSAKAH